MAVATGRDVPVKCNVRVKCNVNLNQRGLKCFAWKNSGMSKLAFTVYLKKNLKLNKKRVTKIAFK